VENNWAAIHYEAAELMGLSKKKYVGNNESFNSLRIVKCNQVEAILNDKV